MDNSVHIENRKSSFPKKFSLSILNIFNEEISNEIINAVVEIGTDISTYIDVSNLKSIIVADGDEHYLKAIQSISPDAKPSNSDVIGVAMTLASQNDKNEIEQNIVFRSLVFAPFISAIEYSSEEARSEDAQCMIQVIAHEFAHVQGATEFSKAFKDTPDKPLNNIIESITFGYSLSCWSEFAACYLSGKLGADPHVDYEEILLGRIKEENDKKYFINKRYYLNEFEGDPYRELLKETYLMYGNILKSASYYLGNVAANNINLDEIESYKEINKTWLGKYIKKFNKILLGIQYNIGQSIGDADGINNISNLLNEICQEAGLVTRVEGDLIYVDLSDETKVEFLVRHKRELN